MNARLLAKIEETYLYIFELKKQLEQMQRELNVLKEQTSKKAQ